MKKSLSYLFVFVLCLLQNALAQPATVSYPFAVGTTSNCGGSTSDFHYYTYNGATNTITNATGGLVNPGLPQLRIGTSGGSGGIQRFTSNYSSVSFNPKDHNIYFFWTAVSGALAPGGIPRTYAWRWPVGTIPTGTTPRLDTIRSFPADILGVAFDNIGKGYSIEFTNALPTTPPTYKPMIRSMDFVTGVIGAPDTLSLTGGAKIYVQGSGDVAMSPSGQMFFVVDNKLFTPNYQSYTGTGANLTCTYIDTVKTTGNFVGLTYADGEAIAAFSGTVAGVACPFQEITLLTAANTPITKTAGSVRSASDMATVVSGVGSAKKLVSVTPTGTPNQYDVIYEIVIKNYGNMDVTNLQVADNLGLINGIGNVSNVSVTIPVNPNGYTVNAGYTGLTPNINLLNGTPSLPNYPVANSSFTIRISCRLSNILSGVVYYNSAIATAIDFNSNNLRDSSTNGDKADLNSNDKPDDMGEGQPTPLLISVTAQTPPCSVLSRILYSQDFGTGTGLSTSIPGATLGSGVSAPINNSDYASSGTAPLATERFTITNNTTTANGTHFISLTDHTGNTDGRMLVVNADAASSVMFRGGFAYALCPKQQYSVSFYASYISNSSYETICNGFGGIRYPKLKIRVKDGVSGLIITEASTADIATTGWQQMGLKFVSPASYSSIVFEIINDAPGGCGNDIALDDIQFGSCDPIPVVGVNSVAGCIGDISTFTGGLTDPGAIPGIKEYQWQVATALAGPYTDIPGATSVTYNINPVTAADTGKYYRLLVAASGNIGSVSCRFNSPGTLLIGKVGSVAATTANKNKNNICGGMPVNLSITGGTLGTNAAWKWYEGSCTGTAIGVGASITVSPTVTTTYYVRAEGDCNTTICQPVTVFITCDIDKDDDGIPDYVESYMPAALLDHNTNSISNAFDPLYPGFKDNNNDFINDDFQADGDSDNDAILNYLDTTFPGRVDSNGDGIDDRFDMDLDGIINMLDLDSDNDGIPDVVEAGGVDADGDGKIDNYTDTDNDGLSQNVDINNTGARISGIGLGVLDFDADSKPNTIDLDSDGDGIPDVVEAGGPDANNNAKIDGFIDVNGDGLIDSYINATALLRTGADLTSDGRADSYPFKNFDNDKRPNAYDVDSDMDGIVDVLDAGFADIDYNGFIDGAISADGWNTALHLLPALNLKNSDGDANYNYLDIDSDGDGIPDNIEGQTTAGYKFPSYLDNDNDGLDNAYDLAPFTVTFGGAGIFLADKDLDLIPDYLDLDTDSDGALDIAEGNDYNFNGFADDLVTPTGVDSDGDGLDDRFDLINSGLNLKGTSSLMGTGGSLVGDPTPGTKATVQKFLPAQPERDWRYVTYVLPLQHLQLSGGENKNNVSLNWSIISTTALDIFEIERSTDNMHFQKIGSQTADMPLNLLSNYYSSDNISSMNIDLLFYRLKVIAKNGSVRFSNVVLIRKNNTKATISIYPNPANDVANLNFFAEKESDIVINIKDNMGKLILSKKQKALKGNNIFPFTGLSRYSNGVYCVQVLLNNELFTIRLIILK